MNDVILFSKRTLTMTVVITTIAWAMGLSMLLVPLAVLAEEANVGDDIKVADSASIYYLGASGRYVYPNAAIFASWGRSLAAVKTVSSAFLLGKDLKGNVKVKPAKLIQLVTNDTPWRVASSKVYAVSANGTARWITTAEVAAALFGTGWESKIVAVPESLWANYTVGANIIAAADYSLTTNEAVTIAQENGGTSTTPTTPVAGAPVTATLGADNPSGATLASGTAFNPALVVTLTAGSQDASVTKMKLTRFGITADTAVTLGLYDSTDPLHSLISTTHATISDNVAQLVLATPATIAANTSKSFYVLANIVATAGTFGLKIAKAEDIEGVAATGTFPITGNTFTLVNGAATVGTATLDAVLVHNNGVNDATTVNVAIGTVAQEIARFRVVAGANEDLNVWGVTLYQAGNASDGDITNIKLKAPNGDVLATAEKTVNRYAKLSFASAYLMPKGSTRDFTVVFDVPATTTAATRNIRFQIQNDYDLKLKGVSTGSWIVAAAAGTVDAAFPMGDASGGAAACAAGNNCINKLTIQAGTLLYAKAGDAPSGSIAQGGSAVVLGKWNATSQGEATDLRQAALTLTWSAAATPLTGTVSLRVNGNSVLTWAANTFTSGVANATTALASYPRFAAGVATPIDVIVSLTTTATGTLSATLDLTQVYRIASNDIIDPGVANIAANTLSINAATLAVNKNTAFPNGIIVAGADNAKVGEFNLTAGARTSISSITVGLTNITNISNLYLKDASTGAQLGSVVTTPAATNVFSPSNYRIQGTATIGVYVTTNAATTGTEVASITAIGATDDSSQTVNATGLTATGQTITFAATGTLAMALDTSNTPVAHIQHSGMVDVPVLAVRLTANNAENIKVTIVQLGMQNGSSSWKDVKLFYNGVQVGSVGQLTNGAVLFQDTNGLFTVLRDNTGTLTVKASTTTSSTINSQMSAEAWIEYLEGVGASGGGKVKPGTTLTTAWTATNITVTGAALTVADTTGFHIGKPVFAYDGTNGGTLGIVTAEPTSATAMTVAGRAALTYAGSATIHLLASGAGTPASAGTAVKAGAAITVTSTGSFAPGMAVLVQDSAGVELGWVVSITNCNTMVVRTITDMTGTAAYVAELGTDALNTATTTTGFTAAPAAVAVTSSTGFNTGDMVLVQDTVGNGSYCMVTAVGSATAMTLGCNAAVTASGTTNVIRVGAVNPNTTLVSTAASAGNRVIAGAAITVTDSTGLGVNDVGLSIAATGGAILGKVSAVASTTALTFNAAAASATTVTRLTRLDGAAAAGRRIVFHDVEPVIINDSSVAGGASTAQSAQPVFAFQVKADGDRNLTFTAVDLQVNGSNLPWHYVTNYDLYQGSNLLASATTLNSAVTGAGAQVLTGNTISLCSAVPTAAGEINLGSAGAVTAAGNKIFVNDRIVVYTDTTNYITARVTAKAAGTACTGAVAAVVLTVANQTTVGTAPTSLTATAVKNFNVIFDANSATPLAAQVITSGATVVYTVKADTTAARTGLGAGVTASYNLKFNGISGPTPGNDVGGLYWGYTPSGGNAIAGLTISDSYSVNGPTFTY
jgi:hypothetical protein